MTEDKQQTLSNLVTEDRRFEPPAELAANANVTAEAYDEAAEDRLAFWAEQAERISLGHRRWTEVLDWDEPAVREVVRRRHPQRRRTTASTATSRPATATGSRSTGSASPRTTPATSPTPT